MILKIFNRGKTQKFKKLAMAGFEPNFSLILRYPFKAAQEDSHKCYDYLYH